MALRNWLGVPAAARGCLLTMAVVVFAGCHKGSGGSATAPQEAEVAVAFAKGYANTNGCENPQLIKARLSSGVWYVSMRSGTGAIAVARVSPDGKLLSYDVHE